MNAGNWIAVGSLLIALVALIIQQTRLINATNRKEKRTETKLRIYYLLQKGDCSEEEIITATKQMEPTKRADEPEIRKALYEMLQDGAVRFTKENKYKARRRKPTKKGVMRELEDEDRIPSDSLSVLLQTIARIEEAAEPEIESPLWYPPLMTRTPTAIG